MTRRSTFDQLYEDNFDYAFRLARLFGAPPGHEEDVVQEAFFTLYEAMKDKRFVDRGSPRPWLRTVIYRNARDFRRVAFHRRRAALARGEGGFDVADVHVQANAESMVGLREESALLLRFLEELNYERRAVFVLHEIQGHTLAEIAQDLGIPLDTVAARVKLAREDLAAILRRYQATQARKMRGACIAPLTVEALVAAVQTCSVALAVPLGARERVWARLQEKIRSMPDSAPALDPSWKPPRFRFKGAEHLISAGAGFVAGVAATLLLIVVTLRHREAPPASPVSERAPTVVVAPIDPAYVPAVLPVQAPAATTAPATASSAAAQADPDAEAHAERRCLQAARAALDATPPNPRKTLAVLAACAQRFPASRLPSQRARLQEGAEAALAASQR